MPQCLDATGSVTVTAATASNRPVVLPGIPGGRR